MSRIRNAKSITDKTERVRAQIDKERLSFRGRCCVGVGFLLRHVGLRLAYEVVGIEGGLN